MAIGTVICSTSKRNSGKSDGRGRSVSLRQTDSRPLIRVDVADEIDGVELLGVGGDEKILDPAVVDVEAQHADRLAIDAGDYRRRRVNHAARVSRAARCLRFSS